jgi:restriction endonuclease
MAVSNTVADVLAIKEEIARRLYEAFFAGQDRLLVREIQQEHGWDDRAFWRALENLADESLAKGLDSGPNYEITPEGIVDWEKRGLAPADLLSANNSARVAILQKYAEAYEAEGRQGEVHYGQVVAAVVRETSLAPELVEANQEFLYNAGYLIHPGSLGYFRITPTALASLRDWQQHSGLKKRFHALAASEDPNERGKLFEQLVGELACEAGWIVERNVLGPGEEIDLVLNRDDSFYLLECRWWSDPVGTKEIRDFSGKLRKRAAVVGVVASMSGFTAPATAEVEGITGETPILLFGPGDVADLFQGVKRLNDVLADKRRSLIQRKAPWS